MNLITVLGPTASGKTSFAANLAHKLKTEIICADSRQIYRGMTIGSGKDINDYTVNSQPVKYHLVDIADAGTHYNVFQYKKDFFDVYLNLRSKNIVPVLCGGTGLYVESIIRNYQLIDVPANESLRVKLENYSLEELKQMLESMKTLHNNTDTDTKKRAIRAIEIESYIKENPKVVPQYSEIDSLVFGVKFPRETERKRIHQRLYQRMDEGMPQEIINLMQSGISAESLIYYGLEYKYVTLYVTGKLKKEEMLTLLEIEICQFAKRQMTWYRRMERNGIKINWIDGNISTEEKIEIALSIIKRNSL